MKTGLLEKTSTPAFKGCSHCKETKPISEFSKNRRRKDGYASQCKVCVAARNYEYYHKRGGADVTRHYGQSERGKASGWKYNQSEKGRARQWKHNHSPKGFARNDRMRQTEKFRATQERFYAKHGGRAAYDRECYHRIQDEAGCHYDPQTFYPGYRFIKALETAEIVEI